MKIHCIYRSTNATHRSLPDIPISESLTGDTNSDLYATVHEKSEKYLSNKYFIYLNCR